MSKQKGPDSVRARGIAKEKTVTVAEDSLQPRAPGWVAPGGASVQSANIEERGAVLRSRGWLQGDSGDLNLGSQRAGGSAQQAGASARQTAQRVRARGEEDRLNASRQSEDSQGSMQGGEDSAWQLDQTNEPVSDYAGRSKSKRSSGSGK
jgi:hypothetical protein